MDEEKDLFEEIAKSMLEPEEESMQAKARKILRRMKKDNSDKVTVPDLQGRGILVVEDDPTESKRAEEAIIELGYLPFLVDNFAKASRALNQSPFLFVLTDLHYPCCSGNNVSVPEQADPQPNGVTFAVKVKMQGGKVAILTNQYHHGSVQWADDICFLLEIPFLDTELDSGEPEENRGKKKWKKAIEILKERPAQTLNLNK